MTSAYKHTVLVVAAAAEDTDEDQAMSNRAIPTILETEKIEYVSADSADSALENLKKTSRPFSLIISDQRIEGMQGTQFLEHAKKLNPAAIRFLVTGYSEMQTIINAVNKGSVHGYISKPWDRDEMVKAIRSGIAQYEQFLENKNLITLAKKQNTRLYELNCELMETAKTHNKILKTLDTEITAIETEQKNAPGKTMSPYQIMGDLQAAIDSSGEKGQEILNKIFSQTINILFSSFNDLAQNNGFEMPFPDKAGSKDRAPDKEAAND